MLIKQNTLLAFHSQYDPDPFNNFPIGLLILEKDPTDSKGKYFIKYSNIAANKLLSVPCNKDIELFKKKLRGFTKLTRLNHFNYEFSETNLCDQIFSNPGNCEVIDEKFVSLNFMIYVKIRFMDNQTLISVDNYNDERKSIQSNIVKNLGYSYLLTLYHEINNPLNCLLGSMEDVASLEIKNEKNEKSEKFSDKIKLLVKLIKIFIKNFILSFKIAFEEMKRININLEFIFTKVSKSFEHIFNYKKVAHEEDYHLLSNKVIISDYFYFKSLLKNIFIYLYHKIERGGGFGLDITIKDANQVKISFVNKSSQNISNNILQTASKETTELDKSFLEELDIKHSVQTIEITKDIIMKLSKLLGTKAKIFGDSTRYYISLIMDYRTEEDLSDDDCLSECSPTTKKRNLSVVTRSISSSGNALINQLSSTLSSTMRNYIQPSQSQPLENVIRVRNRSFTRRLIERPPPLFKRSSEQINADFIFRKMVSYKNPQKLPNSFVLGLKDYRCTAVSTSPRNKTKKRTKKRFTKRGVMSALYKRLAGEKLTMQGITGDSKSELSEKNNQSRCGGKCTPLSFGRNFSFQIDGSGISNGKIPIQKRISLNMNEKGRKTKQEKHSGEMSIDQAIYPEGISLLKNVSTPFVQIVENPLSHLDDYARYGSLSQFAFNIPNEQLPVVGGDFSPKISAKLSFGLDNDPSTIFEDMKKRSISITKVEAPSLRREICGCSDVLIVDDEIFNLNSLQMLLKKNSVTADTCLNGKLGLERIIEKSKKVCSECKSTSYRLIFMDIMMPEMDGLEASQRIQELVNKGELNDEMKIIIISSQENEHIQSIIAKIPLIKEFVPKPVKRIKIEEILKNFYYS